MPDDTYHLGLDSVGNLSPEYDQYTSEHSMSAVITYLYVRNRIKCENNLSCIVGPANNTLFREIPLVVFADASNTIRTFVVLLEILVTAW